MVIPYLEFRDYKSGNTVLIPALYPIEYKANKFHNVVMHVGNCEYVLAHDLGSEVKATWFIQELEGYISRARAADNIIHVRLILDKIGR